jgi:hypothetical protein
MFSEKVVSPVKTGVQCFYNYLELLDVLARFGSLRLPPVARLEFTPMKIGAGMTILRLFRLFTTSSKNDSTDFSLL